MVEYLLVFYLINPDYTKVNLKMAVGPMSKDDCIELSTKVPELLRIYQVENSFFICTKHKEFKKNFPNKKINKEYN